MCLELHAWFLLDCWVLTNVYSPTVYAAQLEDLARQTGAAIAFPYYTPAPDKQFPFQFEQTYEALNYLVTHGDEYDLAKGSVALAGDSVGGKCRVRGWFCPLVSRC